MLSYFALASALTLLTHAYFARRLFAVPGPSRTRFRRALFVHWLALPAAMVLTLRAPAWAAPASVPLAHLTFFDVGFCLLTLFALLARDLGLALAWLASQVTSRLRTSPPADPTRRAALRRALDFAVVGTAGAASAAGYGVALAQPELRRVRVPLDARRLPQGWPGLRVVQLSDVHVGPTLRRPYLEALVATVNAQEPDVVVLTGDLVDGFVSQLRAQLEPLRALRARHGVYFVTGNHEYYYRAHEWLEALGALGVTVLSNSHAVLEHEGARLLLAGVNDPADREHRGEPRARVLECALRDAPECAVKVLLAHRPNDAPAAARAGFDVQLSGHVHAGQFFPLTLLMRATERFVAGLYREGALWLYVNRGAGYWGPPNRLGARQELAVLELYAT